MNEPDRHELLIQPRSGWVPVDWRELYATRELFFTLIMRDLRVRYKQTVLGVGWAVIQPLLTMVVFTWMFRRVVPEGSTGDVPYPLFAYAGLVPWTFFSNAVNAAGISLLTQQHLLTKIYFPRVFAPSSAVGAALVDMLVAFGLFALLMPIYRTAPSWQVVFLPALILVTYLGTLGVGLWTSSMIVLFRDLRYVLTFALQVLMFLTPVIFPITYFPERFRWLLAVNPMFGLVAAFRSSILGTPWDFPLLAISAASSVAMFFFGIYSFRRVERHFADFV